MSKPHSKKPLVLGALAMAALAVWPTLALAYVGPGLGMGALGSVFAFLGAVGLAIVGFVWYPIKRLIRFIKKSADRPQVD